MIPNLESEPAIDILRLTDITEQNDSTIYIICMEQDIADQRTGKNTMKDQYIDAHFSVDIGNRSDH